MQVQSTWLLRVKKNIISNGFVTKAQSSGLHYLIFRCNAIWFKLSVFFVNLSLLMQKFLVNFCIIEH